MIYSYNDIVKKDKQNSLQNSYKSAATAVTPQNINTTAVKSSASDATYVPGNNIVAQNYAEDKTAFANAQNAAKAQRFAVAANAAGPGIPSTNTDYAAQILDLMQQPQTPETQAKIINLQTLRNWKIDQDKEAYGQYKDDSVSRAANAYANRILPQQNNVQSVIDENYAAQQDFAARQFARQANATHNQYSDIRKQLINNAARNALNREENLAAQGLGRGIASGASSGMGETSRAIAESSLNNNLYSAYQNEQNAIDELQAQYNQQQLQASMDYATRAQEQANTDRNYMLSVDAYNAQNAQAERSHDIDKYNAETNRLSTENQYDLSNKQIEQSDKQFYADLDFKLLQHKDELKFGYDQLAETHRSNLANEAVASKQLELDTQYKLGMLSVSQYEAETNRITANAKTAKSIGYSGVATYTPTGSDIGETKPQDAKGMVYGAFASKGKSAALAVLQSLYNSGQINPIETQTLIEDLHLGENDGWLK